MPIYEFACPKCRKIYSFLSKRLNPERRPVCPKCGNKKLKKEVSQFAMTRGLKETGAAAAGEADASALPEMNDPRMERTMLEMERDMAHLDENNPKHMAHMMKKMKDLMPPGSMPKEMDIAIKRLEAGEDPDQLEADLGDVFDQFMGGVGDTKGPAPYSKDAGLYDY
jgi:putative FmdB family regulatory protein